MTPALFLTSMVDMKSLKEGYLSGCCDYIRKPFDLEELEIRQKRCITGVVGYNLIKFWIYRRVRKLIVS
jgi:DNA-binding response OmpR family regulator